MTRDPKFVDVLQVSRPNVVFVPIWLLGNLVAWLGGASWRGITNRHERSLYQMSGFFVLLNGIIAWGLFTLAALGIEETATFAGVAPYTVVWGLFVAAFDRAISAKIVDPTHSKTRAFTGYAVRAICAVLLGFIVAEGGALWIFREDIARTMNDNIAGQVTHSRELIVGKDGEPTERKQALDALKATRKQLDDQANDAEAAYLRAEQFVLCEREPENCPPNIRDSGEVTGDSGNGPQTRAREQQRDTARIARDTAVQARNAQTPELDRKIETAQTDLDTDLRRAQDAAKASNGLPARWRAMIDFTRRDSTAAYMHLLIVGLCVLLDLIPLLLKLWRGRTSYDATVVASRDRRERELDQQHQQHQDTLRRQLDRERIEEELLVDLAKLRANSTRKLEAERERVRLEKEFDRIQSDAEPDATPDSAREPVLPSDDPPAGTGHTAPHPEPEPNGHKVDLNSDTEESVTFPANWLAEDKALLGRVFGNRFRLVEPLDGADNGAFGRVLLAKDLLRDNQRVVIKVVRDADGDKRRLRRSKLHRMWQSEVDAARRLRHPNIGEIITAGLDHGYLWTASPLYESGSLMRWVRGSMDSDPEGYPLKTTFHYIEQLTGALVYAHDHGITHGDIKPTNAVLSGPRLLLVDWGFSRVTTRLEHDDSQPLGGTPLFTAPEVGLRKDFDAVLADLYSVGATWYFLLTGQPPYYDADLEAGVKAIARQIQDGHIDCVRLDTLVPNLPLEVVDLVHALVAVDPRQRRFGDRWDPAAGQLQQALDTAFLEVMRAGRSTVPVGPLAVARRDSTNGSELPKTLLESQLDAGFAADPTAGRGEPAKPAPSHLLLAEVSTTALLDQRTNDGVPSAEAGNDPNA